LFREVLLLFYINENTRIKLVKTHITNSVCFKTQITNFVCLKTQTTNSVCLSRKQNSKTSNKEMMNHAAIAMKKKERRPTKTSHLSAFQFKGLDLVTNPKNREFPLLCSPLDTFTELVVQSFAPPNARFFNWSLAVSEHGKLKLTVTVSKEQYDKWVELDVEGKVLADEKKLMKSNTTWHPLIRPPLPSNVKKDPNNKNKPYEPFELNLNPGETEVKYFDPTFTMNVETKHDEKNRKIEFFDEHGRPQIDHEKVRFVERVVEGTKYKYPPLNMEELLFQKKDGTFGWDISGFKPVAYTVRFTPFGNSTGYGYSKQMVSLIVERRPQVSNDVMDQFLDMPVEIPDADLIKAMEEHEAKMAAGSVPPLTPEDVPPDNDGEQPPADMLVDDDDEEEEEEEEMARKRPRIEI